MSVTPHALPDSLAALRDAAREALDRREAEEARREALLREAVNRQARLEADIPLEIWQYPHVIAVNEAGVPCVEWRIPGYAAIRADYYALNPTWDREPKVRRERWLVQDDCGTGWQEAASLGEALALAERPKAEHNQRGEV